MRRDALRRHSQLEENIVKADADQAPGRAIPLLL
jgi:hypothetical protein